MYLSIVTGIGTPKLAEFKGTTEGCCTLSRYRRDRELTRSGSVNRLTMYLWLSLSVEDADDVEMAFYLRRDINKTDSR